MDRVRRISTELLTRYPDKFASDFEQNKKLINEPLATVRSKVLRNTIAGYITSYLRKNSGQKESEATSLEAEPSEAAGTRYPSRRRSIEQSRLDLGPKRVQIFRHRSVS